MRRTTYGAGVLVTGLLLAACGGGSEPAAQGTSGTGAPATTTPVVTTSTPTATTSTTTTTSSTTPSSTTTTTPAASTSAAAAVVLVLEPDGLGYTTDGSAIRHLPFGSDATSVRSAVTKALGGSLTRTQMAECGQGARTQYDRKGFSLLVDGTKFVGWTDQGASGRRLTTADGIGVGSTIKQIKKSVPGVTTTDGSLGAEFYAESGFGGILDDKATKATLVYAGETCFFR